MRPEDLEVFLESRRSGLSHAYLDKTFASDLTGPAERAFVAREVERLMRALQSDMGLKGGIQSPESG
jgi:hypothetical protein